MNKRGNQDFITMAVIGTVGIILIIVGGLVVNVFKDGFTELNMGDTSNQVVQDGLSDLPAFVDWLGVGFIIALVLFIIISSFLIDVNPVFLIIGIMIWIISLIVGSRMGEMLVSFVTGSSSLQASSDVLPMTTFLLQNWLVIMIITGVIGLIVTFGKLRGARQ